MKKIFSLMCLLFVFMAIGTITVNAGTSINKKNLYLAKGTTETLKVSGTKQKIIWSSDNKKIASINSSGRVSAKKTGHAVIKAKFGFTTLKCNVYVFDISDKNIELAPAKTKTLKLTNAKGTIKWTSSNPSVASVDSKGFVVAKQSGTATVNAKYHGKTVSCKVYIPDVLLNNKVLKVDEQTSASISNYYYMPKFSSTDTSIVSIDSKGNIIGKKVGTAKIKIKTYNGSKAVNEFSKTIKVCKISDTKLYIPQNTSQIINIENAYDVIWTSSKPEIAEVDEFGNITAKKSGECIITGNVSGSLFECNVLVPKLKLDKKEYMIGQTGNIKIKYASSDVEYSSSDTDIIEIDESGKITAKAAGTAEIIAIITDENGNKIELTENITVYDISEKTLKLKIGDHPELFINDLDDIEWSSSDENVATVSKEGIVSAKSGGKCTITAKSGDMTFTSDVVVYELNLSEFTTIVGEKEEELYVKEFKDKGEFESDDEEVAVYEDGKIIPVGPGTCNITCEIDDVSLSCEITVKDVPELARRFVDNLEIYSEYIRDNKNSFINEYQGSVDTFEKAKNKVETGETVGITCVVPIRWALAELGVRRADGKALVSGDNATFSKCYTGDLKNHLERITSGGPIGMTVEEAVDAGLLKKGDILCNEGQTHTYAYSGEDCYVYEGGGLCHSAGLENGVKMDYSKGYYKTRIISEVLRWKYEED